MVTHFSTFFPCAWPFGAPRCAWQSHFIQTSFPTSGFGDIQLEEFSLRRERPVSCIVLCFRIDLPRLDVDMLVTRATYAGPISLPTRILRTTKRLLKHYARVASESLHSPSSNMPAGMQLGGRCSSNELLFFGPVSTVAAISSMVTVVVTEHPSEQHA
jgi:hypothetical protein